MTTRRALELSAILALGALIGCDSDSNGPSEPSDPAEAAALNQHVATHTGEAAAQDIEMMGAPGGQLGLGLSAGGVGTVYRPFRCSSGEIDLRNISLSWSCIFKDAAGTVQTRYDDQTTESVETQFSFSAAIERPNWSASVEREREIRVSGLTGNETTWTWNGSGSGSSTRERHRGETTREYSTEGSFSIDDVVVPAVRSESNWPTSGTINAQITATIVGGPNDGERYQRDVTVTFNGTNLVPITVNGTEYTFNLATRRIVEE